jgi:mRNA interferase MazF
MMRGEVWMVAGGGAYADKPRPAVILQSDRFTTEQSVTICPLTTDPTDAPLVRIAIEPSASNGLRAPSRIMVDKIMTVARPKLGARIGRLRDEEMLQLSRAAMVFLGLAD